MVADLDQCPGLAVHAAEFNNYGSGFASFVEVKLTPDDGSLVTAGNGGVETRGFGLLLNRLAPIAAAQADAAQWIAERSGSGSLPDRNKLSLLPILGYPASSFIGDVLRRHSYEVVSPEVLRQPISTQLCPVTILADTPWTVFDVWFYWYD